MSVNIKLFATGLWVIGLTVAICFSGYLAGYSNNLIVNESLYSKNASCSFVEGQYVNNSIVNKRLMLNVNAFHDNTSSLVLLYYPLTYLEPFKKYDVSHYYYFFNTLKDTSFKCTYDPTTHIGYFNDYNNFHTIYKFLSPEDVRSGSIIAVGVFGVIIVITLGALCCCYRHRHRSYYNQL